MLPCQTRSDNVEGTSAVEERPWHRNHFGLNHRPCLTTRSRSCPPAPRDVNATNSCPKRAVTTRSVWTSHSALGWGSERTSPEERGLFKFTVLFHQNKYWRRRVPHQRFAMRCGYHTCRSDATTPRVAMPMFDVPSTRGRVRNEFRHRAHERLSMVAPKRLSR